MFGLPDLRIIEESGDGVGLAVSDDEFHKLIRSVIAFMTWSRCT